MIKKWSGADMRCQKCNKYLPDRCTCNGPSIESQRNNPKETMNHATTAQEYVNRFNAGETQTSISMGGLGAGYELGIQRTTVVFLTHMLATNFNINEQDTEKLRQSWFDLEAVVVKDPDFDEGLSGAMFGAAQSLAAHFYRKGPAAVMTEEAVLDRHILVSKTKVFE